MTAIYKRELMSYFRTVIGWLFMSVTLFFVDLYVTVYNVMQGYPYLAYPLQASLILFIVSVPVLTMRVLAEERKNRTDQMSLTAPVTVGKIVLGKYLALETILLLPCLLISLYPVFLGQFGEVAYAESYVGILAFFLYGSTAIAIGMFLSSLTESQVISAVLSVLFLFLGFIMDGICGLINQVGGTPDSLFAKILGVYDLTTPYSNLISGSLDLTSIYYYLSLILLFLFLTTQSIQKRRYTVSVKRFTLGAYNLAVTVVLIAILVVSNLLVKKIPLQYTMFDLTRENMYTLTQESILVIKRLDTPITIYVLATEDNMDETVAKTLQQYADYSKEIQVEYVNPATNPTFSKQYVEEDLTAGSLLVVSEKRNRAIPYESLYETQLSYETYEMETTGYDAEGQITSALAYVTGDDLPKLYFLTGHGEKELPASFLGAIGKLNIESDSLNLLTAEAVPEDAECLVINAPTADLSEEDEKKVRTYLEQGGNALFLYGYSENTTERYQGLLKDYGVTFEKGIVVEQDTDHYYQNPLYLLPFIEYSDLTGKAMDNYVFMPYVLPIRVEEEKEGLSYLLKSSESSFARTDMNANNSLEKTEEDAGGPFALGVDILTEKGRIVAYTSGELFTENADAMVAGNNLQLFKDTVSALFSVDGNVSIPVKSFKLELISFSIGSMIWIGMLMVLVIPLMLLFTGIGIWLKRRKR